MLHPACPGVTLHALPGVATWRPIAERGVAGGAGARRGRRGLPVLRKATTGPPCWRGARFALSQRRRRLCLQADDLALHVIENEGVVADGGDVAQGARVYADQACAADQFLAAVVGIDAVHHEREAVAGACAAPETG